ncbi:MAG TPA: hypothetical protein EYG88_01895 [Desulfocapsa sulfexigens]|nr:hypothetical protein [Desulfocapsa sulfexigens]
MMMQKRIIFIFLAFLVFFVLVNTGSTKEPKRLNREEQKALTANVSSVLEKVEGIKAVVPANRFAEEGKKRAKQTAEVFRTPEFQSSIEREQKRLNNEVFKKYTATCEKQKQEEVGPDPLEDKEQPETTQKIYLFISSSLPDETMHSYLNDISRANSGAVSIVPVMQGMINGIKNKGANKKYFSRILKEDMTCVDDFQHRKACDRFKTNILFQPPLFAKYGIERVPALVYDNDGQILIIQGDASIDYLMERINREAKQERLETLISKIRGRINE